MRGFRLPPGREAHLFMCACGGIMLFAVGCLTASDMMSDAQAIVDAMISGVAATAVLAVAQS